MKRALVGLGLLLLSSTAACAYDVVSLSFATGH
jgi:hypothetical protein